MPSSLRISPLFQDFEKALEEVLPKFGADNQELQTLYANGIVPYGKEFQDVRVTLERLVEQTRLSERTPIMSVRTTYGGRLMDLNGARMKSESKISSI